MTMKAFLLLDTGDVFPGEWIGQPREAVGEIVFYTGMTGYQEVLTDPSYGGQIVTFTYPMIGNYGVHAGEDESPRPQAAGIVVGEYCPHPSPYGKAETLAEKLDRHGIPGISGIDTRAVTTIVREKGLVRGRLSCESRWPRHVEWPDSLSLEWVQKASVTQPETYGKNDGRPHIVLIDYGRKQSIVEALLAHGCRVTAVPFNWSNEQILALRPDGLLLSNGPGDPQALSPYAQRLRPLLEQLPTLGICLGQQVVALAFGASTERMPYGHRGSNHPVKSVSTDKVWITSQNHGYVVVKESLDPDEWELTYVNVNDDSVEGFRHKRYPIQCVQFHPEARPGPAEAEVIFQQFVREVNRQRKETTYA